jgi:hypothetical protein
MPRTTSPPADYRRYPEALRPCVVQILGGESLRRDDVVEIVRTARPALPDTILVSNWSEMTEGKYLVRMAGMDWFGVSQGFFDPRHGDLARAPQPLSPPERLISRLAWMGHDDVLLNSGIAAGNAGESATIADEARGWGANPCCGAYFPTTNRMPRVSSAACAETETSAYPDRVEARRDQTDRIVDARATLQATRRYFAAGGAPGCKTGLRFLVVTADGSQQPCSMQFRCDSLAELRRMLFADLPPSTSG